MKNIPKQKSFTAYKTKVFLALPRFFIFYNFLLISDLFLSVTYVGRLEGWMDCCVKEIQAKNVSVCVCVLENVGVKTDIE